MGVRSIRSTPLQLLNDLSVFVEAKDVDTRPVLVRVGWPDLAAVKNHKLSFGDGAHNADLLTRILTGMRSKSR